MKLLLEATVAGKSQVLADGLVRVHVVRLTDDAPVIQTVGRLSVTVELWTWVRDWIHAAVDLGLVEIDVHEIEYRPDHAKRPETMRGRLLDAVESRARMPQDAPGGSGGPAGDETPQGEPAKHRIGRLFREVQAQRKGK